MINLVGRKDCALDGDVVHRFSKDVSQSGRKALESRVCAFEPERGWITVAERLSSAYPCMKMTSKRSFRTAGRALADMKLHFKKGNQNYFLWLLEIFRCC